MHFVFRPLDWASRKNCQSVALEEFCSKTKNFVRRPWTAHELPLPLGSLSLYRLQLITTELELLVPNGSMWSSVKVNSAKSLSFDGPFSDILFAGLWIQQQKREQWSLQQWIAAACVRKACSRMWGVEWWLRWRASMGSGSSLRINLLFSSKFNFTEVISKQMISSDSDDHSTGPYFTSRFLSLILFWGYSKVQNSSFWVFWTFWLDSVSSSLCLFLRAFARTLCTFNLRCMSRCHGCRSSPSETMKRKLIAAGHHLMNISFPIWICTTNCRLLYASHVPLRSVYVDVHRYVYPTSVYIYTYMHFSLT